MKFTQQELRKTISDIHTDSTTTFDEKNSRRQGLLSGSWWPGCGKFRLSSTTHRPIQFSSFRRRSSFSSLRESLTVATVERPSDVLLFE